MSVSVEGKIVGFLFRGPTVIDSYCIEHEVSRDLFSENDFVTSPRKKNAVRRKNVTGVPVKPVSETMMQTYKLFHEQRLSLVSLRAHRPVLKQPLGGRTTLSKAVLRLILVVLRRQESLNARTQLSNILTG